jgi:hypothetical protein
MEKAEIMDIPEEMPRWDTPERFLVLLRVGSIIPFAGIGFP